MIDIIIVASNSIVRNPRIWKIVSSLRKRYATSGLGWNREALSSKEIGKYIVDLTQFNVKAPFGRPHLVLYYPCFWTWVLLKLIKYRPRVVHAIDLDTLLPSVIYKLIFRTKLLYEVHDRYAGYVPPNSKKLFSLMNLIEELLAKRADVLVTVSAKVLDTFRRRPKVCAIIMNCSEDYRVDINKSNNANMTLVYTGLIRKDLGLQKITAAIKDLKGVQLVTAGRVADRDLLNEMLKLSNVMYKGHMAPNDSLRLEASSDVMVALYDLQYPKNKLSSPNKVFEAMMCSIPLITNMEQELVGKEVGCGIIVDYDNLDQIKQAIILLRDNVEVRSRMGKNGRRAFEDKYNWNIMEQKLYDIYNKLLEDKSE
jgi:glycosyltransferase involved in cell wall biosynthesis